MPEIAEIARITHFLRKHLVGKRITSAVAPHDANVFGKVGATGHAFEQAVAGKRVVGAGNQGKYFWILLETPPHPVMHFGMTGWIHIRGEQTAYTRYYEKLSNDPAFGTDVWPPKFWRFQLETDGDPSTQIAFTDARRFGRVRLVDCEGVDIRQHTPLVENGPDPVVDCDSTFTVEYLRGRMRARRVPVKALLLDQSVLSGIGNWVGDEIMFQARMHPEQPCNEFSDADVEELFRTISFVCQTAIGCLGDSDQFPSNWLFNYRWGKGKKDAAVALPTGEKIAFLTVGGRTSCIVPSLQKKRAKRSIDGGKVKTEEEGDTEAREPARKGAGKGKRKRISEVKGEDETVVEKVAEGKESRFFTSELEGAISRESKKPTRTLKLEEELKDNTAGSVKLSKETTHEIQQVAEREVDNESGGIKKRRKTKTAVSISRDEAMASDLGKRRSGRLRGKAA